MVDDLLAGTGDRSKKEGSVAEWLGRALQKLLQRFESARNLPGGQDGKITILSAFFFGESRIQAELNIVAPAIGMLLP